MDDIQSRTHERLALLLAGATRNIRRMVQHMPADGSLLDALCGRGLPDAAVRECCRIRTEQVPKLLSRICDAGWRWVTPELEDYPALLEQSNDPPLGLFCRGRVPRSPAVAVVGARKASPYGLRVARTLGDELARIGVVVVSGMALGVDAATHAGCLDAGGTTVAVWGTGPDRVYPATHGPLAARIAETGAIVTEYPPGTPPRRHHFPQRNRIIAGLSHVVVVVEATARSGALVTARLALDEGREVMAVPGSIFSPLSAGPNALLRMGARPMLTVRDIAELLDLQAPSTTGAVSGPATPLLGILADHERLAVDEIAERCDSSVSAIMAELLELELAGRVRRLDDGSYCIA